MLFWIKNNDFKKFNSVNINKSTDGFDLVIHLVTVCLKKYKSGRSRLP